MDELEIEKDLLLVEDDLDFASLMLKRLERFGLVIDLATSVEEAQEFLNKERYKLISLDVFLGQNNCAPLIREIRTEGHVNCEVKVIVLSAHTNQDFVQRIESKGIQAFSKKSEIDQYFDFISNEFQSLVHQQGEEEAESTLEELPVDVEDLDLAA